MTITGETKFFTGIIIGTLLIIGAAMFFFNRSSVTFSSEELLPGGSGIKGLKKSSVQLIEFSDFQCPSCKNFVPVVENIINKYGDQLFFGYRHFPLPQHKFAEFSAKTAEAAGKQNKFWEMHSFLFENQERLSEEIIIDGAKKLGMDMELFEKDIASSEIENIVIMDKAQGVKFGVDATPTFFLNGTKLVFSSFSDLEKMIKEELDKN